MSSKTPNLTNYEILEKAISKAINNGWDCLGNPELKVGRVREAVAPRGFGEYEIYLGPDGNTPYYICTHSVLIFNPRFAKALWGEERHDWSDECKAGAPAWQWHLEEMVVADDPIKYLGDNI